MLPGIWDWINVEIDPVQHNNTSARIDLKRWYKVFYDQQECNYFQSNNLANFAGTGVSKRAVFPVTGC